MSQAARCLFVGILRPAGIVAIAPAIVAASAAILIGLLGIFIAWLTVFWLLVAATVVGDLVRHSRRRMAASPITELNRAVGYPGR